MYRELRTVNSKDLADYKIHVLREYGSFRKELTQSEKGAEIIEYASNMGWTKWETLSGQVLKTLGYDKPITKWMVNSVFSILENMTWQPKGDRVWALFIHYWMYEKGPFPTIESVLESLPGHMDRAIANEWVTFFEYRLMDSIKTQRICRLKDEKGEYVTGENISENFARRELEELTGETNINELLAKGYSYEDRFIFFHEIEEQENIPEEQKKLVRKKLNIET
jgi:hypothetical protein